MTSGDLLDFNQIQQLINDMGGEAGEIIPDLVVSLQNDVTRSIHEMRTALEQADNKALRQAAHRLKSSCASLGAAIAASLCQELETMGQNGEIADAAPLIERLDSVCSESISALSNLEV